MDQPMDLSPPLPSMVAPTPLAVQHTSTGKVSTSSITLAGTPMAAVDGASQEVKIKESAPHPAEPLPTQSRGPEELEERIAKDEWDSEAWIALISHAQTLSIDRARPIYERFLTKFPTSGKYWKAYVEAELDMGNVKQAQKIFQRSLPLVLQVDLYRAYVAHVQKTQSNDRGQISDAFEFALDHVGGDLNSTVLWQDYIDFLRSQPTKNTYEEQVKMSALRKVYQRAIGTPLHNLEAIWKQYNKFEEDLNKILAKSLIAEHASRYMPARATYRERKRYYDGLIRNLLPTPPSTSAERSKIDQHQLALWRRLVAYEKRNPEKLDADGLRRRGDGNIEEATEVYQRALKALPTSLLLNFNFADMLEAHKQYPQCKEVYDKLIEAEGSGLVFIQYMKMLIRTEGIKPARLVFKRARSSPKGNVWQVYLSSALAEWTRNKDATVARNVFDLSLRTFPSNPTLWLHYLRFLQHSNEEHNIRALFERAVSQLKPEEAVEIWNEFLDFELEYGDYASVQKVQKRKNAVYAPNVTEGEVSNVIERYRYLDLWPCSTLELTMIPSAAEQAEAAEQQSNLSATSDRKVNAKLQARLSRFPKPDLNQVMPLDLSAASASAQQARPDIVLAFVSALPNPMQWMGPFVDIEHLLTLFAETPLPPPPEGVMSAHAPPATGPVGGSVPAKESSAAAQARKRKVEEEEEEEEEAAAQSGQQSKPQDLFRRRQAAKLGRR